MYTLKKLANGLSHWPLAYWYRINMIGKVLLHLPFGSGWVTIGTYLPRHRSYLETCLKYRRQPLALPIVQFGHGSSHFTIMDFVVNDILIRVGVTLTSSSQTSSSMSDAGGWGPGRPLTSTPLATLARSWLWRSRIADLSAMEIPLPNGTPHAGPTPWKKYINHLEVL